MRRATRHHVFRVHISAVREQHRHDGSVALLCSNLQWRVAALRKGGASAGLHGAGRGAAVVRCRSCARATHLGSRVHARPALQQRPHHAHVVVPRGGVQRQPAAAILRGNSGALS